MLCRIHFALSLLMLLFLAGTSFAATGEEIKSAIEARCKITKPGFLGDYREIGSVLVVMKEGLRANRPSASFKPNVITGDRIIAAGGGDLPLGGNIDGNLKIGDRLYLYGIRTGADFVQLDIFTVKTYVVTGTRGPTPLQASVRFHYDEGLGGVSVKRVIEDIGSWLKTEGEVKSDGEAGPGGEAKPKGDDGTTRTIQVGQTQEEVTAILGQPDKKILLGKKTVFVYQNLKVVFVDGRVSDAY